MWRYWLPNISWHQSLTQSLQSLTSCVGVSRRHRETTGRTGRAQSIRWGLSLWRFLTSSDRRLLLRDDDVTSLRFNVNTEAERGRTSEHCEENQLIVSPLCLCCQNNLLLVSEYRPDIKPPPAEFSLPFPQNMKRKNINYQFIFLVRYQTKMPKTVWTGWKVFPRYSFSFFLINSPSSTRSSEPPAQFENWLVFFLVGSTESWQIKPLNGTSTHTKTS